MITRTVRRSAKHHSGFTLIELMIAVVVLAIIVGIAVPSYQAQILKSRRTDARNALLDIAAREERYLSVANSYSAVSTDVGYSGAWPQTLINGYYTVTVAAPPAAVPQFQVTATPVGAQAADTACAIFQVDQIGQQRAWDSGGIRNDALCWGN